MRNPFSHRQRRRRPHSVDGVVPLPFPPLRDYPTPQPRRRSA
jgi:hypothetical protein